MLKLAIQSAIIDRAAATQFLVVKYAASGKPIDPSLSAFPPISPSTPILCNEVSAQFQPDLLHGRRRLDTRSSWVFLLMLKFPAEVSLEEFEQDLIQNPIIVPSPDGSRQAIVRLISVDYDHPVHQQGPNGTAAQVRLEVEPSRN